MSVVDLDAFTAEVVAAQDAREAEIEAILARGARAMDAPPAARRCQVCGAAMQLRTRTLALGRFVDRIALWTCVAHPFAVPGEVLA